MRKNNVSQVNCAIIEDEPLGAKTLEALLQAYEPEFKVVALAANVTEARKILKDDSIDLFFIDIELNEGTSLDILGSIELQKDQHIVFTTAYEEYGAKAFAHGALHYLLKPIDPAELNVAISRYKTAVGRAVNDEKEKDDAFMLNKLALPTQTGTLFVDFSAVVRIQSANKFSVVYTTDKKQHIVSRPLSRFEEVLEGKGFLRVHDSHLINLNHLKRYAREGKAAEIVLSDDSKVPVSSRRKDTVNAIFRNLL